MGTKNIIIIIIIIPNIRWWKQEKINKILQLHTTTPSPFKNTKPILLSYVLFKRASPYYDTHVIQFSYLKCYKIMMQALKNKKYYILLKKYFLTVYAAMSLNVFPNMHTHTFFESKQTAAVEILVNNF